MSPRIGIYEKALPANISWYERLALAKGCGYDFVEMSIDESDARLARLDWSIEEQLSLVEAKIKTGVDIPSICLSGHRRFPFGSQDKNIRQHAYIVMEKAIKLAANIGVRTLQLAGYDVYYEESSLESKQFFLEGMKWSIALAAKYHIMLAMEIMDTEFMNSITKWLKYDQEIQSPWFCVYPDIGNLSAWNSDSQVLKEIKLGLNKIVAFHLKDTYKVTDTCQGQFRDVPFGEGCVDFVNFFKYLKEVDYKGAFMIEMWTEKADDPLVEVIKARHWIENKMKEGGFLC